MHNNGIHFQEKKYVFLLHPTKKSRVGNDPKVLKVQQKNKN